MLHLWLCVLWLCSVVLVFSAIPSAQEGKDTQRREPLPTLVVPPPLVPGDCAILLPGGIAEKITCPPRLGREVGGARCREVPGACVARSPSGALRESECPGWALWVLTTIGSTDDPQGTVMSYWHRTACLPTQAQCQDILGGQPSGQAHAEDTRTHVFLFVRYECIKEE